MKMAEQGGDGGEESSAMTSPTGGKVKFICSHGGKILPRPSDGTLKYVGGETRVVAVPRSITFSELMNKLNKLFDGEYILKYQIASEDLDSLVSVKTDEDIRHLLDEYDRLERGGSKLRTFLFPIKPVIIENHASTSVRGPPAPEQRFVDAINGIVRPPNINLKPPPSTTRLKSFSPSPTDGSSPPSVSPCSVAHSSPVSQNSLISSLQSRLARMHRIQSSPSICSFGSSQQSLDASFVNNCIHQQPHGHYCPTQLHQHNHHGHQSPCKRQDHQIHSHHGCQSPPLLHDHHGHSHHGHQSPTKLLDHRLHPFSQPTQELEAMNKNLAGGGYGKVSFAHESRYHHNSGCYHPLLRAYPGSGGHKRWGPLEQYATAAFGNNHLLGVGTSGENWE